MRNPRNASFVGRTGELSQLMRLFGAAAHGEAQLALIQGPPGIGKTSLAQEVAVRAHRRGSRVGVGRCWQDGEAPPLWPWRAILRDLGAPEGLIDERPAEATPGRFARFVAVLEYLRTAPTVGPFVIVVDDAHLADPATLLLTRFLVRERRGLPLLLIATRRDEPAGLSAEVADLLTELDREAAVIPLGALSAQEAEAYLSTSLEVEADPELLRVATAVTQGHPLHLRSFTLQSGLHAGGLRGGLEQAIAGVLGQLLETERRLVAVAALLGPEVSVHEVARVAEASPAAATEALVWAVRLGLATEGEAGRFAFVHDLVRQAALATLATQDRLDLHSRAAALLRSREPQALLRRAHHALAAATRSPEDAAAAVTIVRETARALPAADGFETAAALLGRAADVQSAALSGPAAGLAVERAEAVLACGRLADARPLFQQAARLAETEQDTDALARAALGLGGVWVGEHRLADEAERVLALQRRALEALPKEQAVLRARLTARLAAEGVYRGQPVTPMLEAVDLARATGDTRAMAEALSLCHHALMTPEYTWRRPALASELVAVAAAGGDELFSLLGLSWRTVDLFLLGDPSAVSALGELQLRADALRCRSVLFIVRAMEVMLAIRAGEFDRAEAASAACFELGKEVGDADALAFHGAHMSALRFYQGREAELADMATAIASSPTLIEERERAFSAAAALCSLRAGRPEPARVLLERLGREGLESIPASSSWFLAMFGVAETAAALGDVAIAEQVYDALVPYAELPVMGSQAIVCFGSVHRILGVASLTAGKIDRAIEHLTAAVTANERLGHRPAAIQCRAELALAQLRRGTAGELPRAKALLDEAMAAAEAAGMGGLVSRWREAAEAQPPVVASESTAARMSLVRAGQWRVTHEGHVATVPDRVGMRYVARLLAAPDREIAALALVVDGEAGQPARCAHPVMDRRAVAALRERIRQLRQQEVLGPAEQEELGTLTRELARVSGLGGRIRSFADAPERARTAVRKAIKRAIQEIGAANPAIGQHLEARLETGTVCCYHVERSKAAGA